MTTLPGGSPFRAACRLAAAFGLALGLATAGAVPVAAQAVTPDEMLANPAQEARARALFKRLRCLVCQNQSIDDSNAPLARDLRVLVRERIAAGDDDSEVIGFLTRRYGDFVLLKPPVEPKTWGLWFGPLAVLLVAALAILVAWHARGRRAGAVAAPLSADEHARLARILEADEDEDGGGDPGGVGREARRR